MFSKLLTKKHFNEGNGFRWRGGDEITRIEGLSDAVFAFAVTLLVVSLEVPKTFNELAHMMWGFGTFAACFAQLMVVWYQQYLFYRRYNLQDLTSTVLTMSLLFVIMFYVYPLKFVFATILQPRLADDPVRFESYSQLSQLFVIYAVGVIAVFTVFALMYLHAYRFRDALELTPLERFDTLHSVREMFGYILVGLTSLIAAVTLPDELVSFAGLVYALTGFVMWAHGSWSAKRRKRLEAELGLA